MLTNLESALVYDVEVFKHNSMVVFKDMKGETVKVFSSSLDGLGSLWEKGLITEEGYDKLEQYITNKTLIGYNNYHYDDYILRAMTINLPAGKCRNALIKEWNDSIITKGSQANLQQILCCRTLDAFQQIDVSSPGLKKIEGNAGLSIVESAIDFDIDRPLTPKENLETFLYCEYDVLQTLEIFKMRQEYFESKAQVLSMLPEHMQGRAVKWNTTSIIGQLLKPRHPKSGKVFVPEEMFDRVPTDVKSMWSELEKSMDYKFKKKKTVVNELGCQIEFGWGGLHGAPVGIYEAKDVKLLDVASMYPNILINFEGLGEKTELYQEILDTRLRLKAEGRKKEQAPYKLILNSTYGLLNNKYNSLFRPGLAFSICIYGQVSLYVLSQMLHAVGCRVFNINTDGVAFEPDQKGNYKSIVAEWESDFGLTLEEESFKSWIQCGVNDYVAVSDDGWITTKGGDVNNYLDYGQGGRNYLFNNSNIRIVQKAIVDKIVYGKSIPETVWNNRNQPELYQYILQAGRTYQGTYDNNDNKLQNVNRVFAGKNTGYEIFKKRADGGLVKFPDTPEHMFLYNGNLSELEDFEKRVDLDWYNRLAERKIKRWGY